MHMSDEDLKAKYDEYNAAGKFDYLKSYSLDDAEKEGHLSGHVHYTLSEYMKNMFEFTKFKASDIPKIRNMGFKRAEEFAKGLANIHGLLYETGNIQNEKSDMQDLLKSFPTFENLLKDGTLDIYLAQGERRATQRDPQWRQKLGLPAKEQDLASVEEKKLAGQADSQPQKEQTPAWIKFDQYDAAGKFDYLKSYHIDDLNLPVRAHNRLESNQAKTLYDVTKWSSSQVSGGSNFGKSSKQAITDALDKAKGFMFAKYPPSANITTFEELYRSGELDSYLAEGERLATERDPAWREKLGLPVKAEVPAAKSEQTIVSPEQSQEKEAFIAARIQEWSAGREDLLRMPLHDAFIGFDNKEATDQMIGLFHNNGIYIIGQYVIEQSIASLRHIQVADKDIDDISNHIEATDHELYPNTTEPLVIFMQHKAEIEYQKMLEAEDEKRLLQEKIAAAQAHINKIAGYSDLKPGS